MQRKYFELIWLRGVGELKADTKNSHLGMIWWVLEPLLLSCLFYLAFASGIRGGDDGFIFLLLSGMLPFKWTASCISGCASILTINKGIMGQVYLPKWIFPTSVNISMFIRYTFVLPLLLLIIVYSGVAPTLAWFSLCNVVLCQLFFNLGIGYFIAAWVPFIPDLKYVVPLLVTALLFTSGIFFDINDRPEDIQAILRLNPFVEIIDGYRAVLLRGEVIVPTDMLYAWVTGIVFLIVGGICLKVFDRYYPRALS